MSVKRGERLIWIAELGDGWAYVARMDGSAKRGAVPLTYLSRLETSVSDLQSGLENFYSVVDPQKLEDETKINEYVLWARENGEATLLERLFEKYGLHLDEVDSSEKGWSDVRARLDNFYAKYDPFKSQEAIDRVFRFTKRSGLYALNERLVQKYRVRLHDVPFDVAMAQAGSKRETNRDAGVAGMPRLSMSRVDSSTRPKPKGRLSGLRRLSGRKGSIDPEIKQVFAFFNSPRPAPPTSTPPVPPGDQITLSPETPQSSRAQSKSSRRAKGPRLVFGVPIPPLPEEDVERRSKRVDSSAILSPPPPPLDAVYVFNMDDIPPPPPLDDNDLDDDVDLSDSNDSVESKTSSLRVSQKSHKGGVDRASKKERVKSGKSVRDLIRAKSSRSLRLRNRSSQKSEGGESVSLLAREHSFGALKAWFHNLPSSQLPF